MSNALVIDTPEGIAHYRMTALISALSIETSTGMKMSRGINTLHVARQYGFEGRTKVQALKFMKELYKETYGREYGAK